MRDKIKVMKNWNFLVVVLLAVAFIISPVFAATQTTKSIDISKATRAQLVQLLGVLQEQLRVLLLAKSKGQTAPPINSAAPVSVPVSQTQETTRSFLGVSVTGRAQPYLQDPLGRAIGIIPGGVGDMAYGIPDAEVNISAWGSGLQVKNPTKGIYQVSNTKCIKGEMLYFTISFASEKNMQERDVSWICSSSEPEGVGKVVYGKDMKFSFSIDPLSPNPIQMIYTVQPPVNPQSSHLGLGQSPQTQISWSAPGGNIKVYKVYARRDDYPKFDSLMETTKTNVITPHPWLYYLDESNGSRDFMKLWRYAVVSVNNSGEESPVIYTMENHIPLVTRFDASPKCGPAPLTVRFTDRSLGSPVAWSWDFDLTNTDRDSAQQNPIHVFTKEGTYTVELTVGGPQGTDTEVGVGAVEVNNKGTCSN